MGRVCRAEQSQVLVRAPRQPETPSALPFVALNLPLSLAESNCLFINCPVYHPCPDTSCSRRKLHALTPLDSSVGPAPASVSGHVHRSPALSVQQFRHTCVSEARTQLHPVQRKPAGQSAARALTLHPPPSALQAPAKRWFRIFPFSRSQTGKPRQKAAASCLALRKAQEAALTPEPRSPDMIVMFMAVIDLSCKVLFPTAAVEFAL